MVKRVNVSYDAKKSIRYITIDIVIIVAAIVICFRICNIKPVLRAQMQDMVANSQKLNNYSILF